MRGWLVLIVILLPLILSGCGAHSLYPVTMGSHAPSELFGRGHLVDGHLVLVQPQRVVVGANHAGIEHALSSEFLRLGYVVVERAQLQRILQEQNLRISLADSVTKLNQEILAAGKLAGATQIVFAEASFKPERVAIRGVAVDTGEVRWSGVAMYRESAAEPDHAVISLSVWALWRATCRTEDVSIWEEPSPDRPGGCRDTPAQVKKQQEYQWLLTEKQALDEEKKALDIAKQVLDQERAQLTASPGQQQAYSERVKVYSQKVDAYKARIATYETRLVDLNRKMSAPVQSSGYRRE